MDDSQTQVLLTGPTGFIGGRLLHALDEKGFGQQPLDIGQIRGSLKSKLEN